MTQLEGSGLFSTVNLDSLKQTTIQSTLNLKSFEITCQKKAEAQKASDKKAASS